MKYFLKHFFIACTIVATSFFSGSLFIHAQEVVAKIIVSPEFPEPRSVVTLTLSTYSFNLDTSLITWSVNGAVVLSGEGETTLQVRTGDVGEVRNITVLAESKTGYLVEQQIALTPASVTLLYEAPLSHVPYFYEGRSFAANGGLVRVTALPSLSDGAGAVPASSLSYTWYVNDEVVKKQSGRGKQSADIRLDYLRSRTSVRVVVRTPLGAAASKTISITPFTVDPIFYRFDEVFGTLLNSPVRGRVETSAAIPLIIEPYFLSTKESKPPVYKWLLDGFDVTPLGGRVLALSPEENSYGAKQLTVQMTGHDRRLQSAQTDVEVIFDSRK